MSFQSDAVYPRISRGLFMENRDIEDIPGDLVRIRDSTSETIRITGIQRNSGTKRTISRAMPQRAPRSKEGHFGDCREYQPGFTLHPRSRAINSVNARAASVLVNETVFFPGFAGVPDKSCLQKATKTRQGRGPRNGREPEWLVIRERKPGTVQDGNRSLPW